MVDRARAGPSGPDIGPGWARLGQNTCCVGRRPHGASGLLLGSSPWGQCTVVVGLVHHGSQTGPWVERVHSPLSVLGSRWNAPTALLAPPPFFSLAVALPSAASSAVLTLGWLSRVTRRLYGFRAHGELTSGTKAAPWGL